MKSDEKKYIIKNLKEDNATCSDYEYGSLELPCRHLFFARKDQNLELFNFNTVNDRHNISLLRAKVTDDEFNVVSSIPNLDSIKS